MASAKKSVFKRVLIIILAVLVVHCAGSMVATKLIYDSIFSRYAAELAEPAPELRDMVEARECFFYEYEDLTLAGYLYRCQTPTIICGRPRPCLTGVGRYFPLILPVVLSLPEILMWAFLRKFWI